MSRSVFFWNSGGTVDGNILPERKAQKRCFMFGDFLCSKFRTGGFHMKQITGNKLLVKALKEEGVEVLPCGVQYKVLVKGKGTIPSAKSMVQVHYKGTLINGKEFDNSFKRNRP